MSNDETKTKFHAPPELWDKLKPLAREMRRDSTPAEDALWQKLRNRGINGAKFRRQYGIERFIVDFACIEAHLIIEVDGTIHDKQHEFDAVRQAFLESQGFRVLRFRNEQVLSEMDGVLIVIAETLAAENLQGSDEAVLTAKRNPSEQIQGASIDDWEGFVNRMYGALSDDPIERPPQLPLEERDPIE